MAETQYPHCDLALSRRLELCEAKSNASFVESRARLEPASGAAWLEYGGAYAMFDGAGSPLTQTFGFGVASPPSEEVLLRLEEFLEARGAQPFHEVSPLSGNEALAILGGQGYRPVEVTSVLYRPLPASLEPGEVPARVAAPDEVQSWAETAAEGWSELAEVSALMHDLARVTASSSGTTPFFAEVDGRPVATGALAMHDGVALLAGASTVPSARNRGAQGALLEARLRHASEAGCDLAMMCAYPGSTSQKNAERQGFRVAYTRVKWGR
ncbi:MAG TPA: GNAT family N-acetyltransferase [Thermoanaerobaculia bacterium]|jgi:GNAT superfamily N-acetyltransferase